MFLGFAFGLPCAFGLAHLEASLLSGVPAEDFSIFSHFGHNNFQMLAPSGEVRMRLKLETLLEVVNLRVLLHLGVRHIRHGTSRPCCIPACRMQLRDREAVMKGVDRRVSVRFELMDKADDSANILLNASQSLLFLLNFPLVLPEFSDDVCSCLPDQVTMVLPLEQSFQA